MTINMGPKAVRAALRDVEPFRALYLQQLHTQIRFDSCHWRGWSDEYLLKIEDEPVGYGSIKGKDELKDRDTVFEFFVIPPFGTSSRALFAALLEASGATHVQCQSNDPLLNMEVREDRRRRGFGTLVLQEAKKACYLAGRIPAARTSIDNLGSRATLAKAGLRVSGFMLMGVVKR